MNSEFWIWAKSIQRIEKTEVVIVIQKTEVISCSNRFRNNKYQEQEGRAQFRLVRKTQYLL